MLARRLKWIRIALAAVMFTALTAALVDFRGLVPVWAGKNLAGIQFVPSLVALLTGASLPIVAAAVLMVTIGVGRIYCSTVCPLGIFQDIVHRLRSWLGKKHLLRFITPITWLRQTVLWTAGVTTVAGFGGIVLSLLDPYSNFGRIASCVFRPSIVALNNQAVGLAARARWTGLYRVDVIWPSAAVLAFAVGVLVTVTLLAFARGRLFCNTICPVGTLLGMVSSRAAFRIEIDKTACQRCARCLKACKAQCIDLRSYAIDFSRCVACYNCIDVCEDAGIGYRFAWRREPRNAKRNPLSHERASESVANPQRRDFIGKTMLGAAITMGLPTHAFADGEKHKIFTSRKGNESAAVSPPGSRSVAAFLNHCTACHLCVSACPTGVLQPAAFEFGLLGFMKPRLDFRQSFCNYECRRCGEVCPDGAIQLSDLAVKKLIKIGEAEFIRDICVVVTNGTDCAACSEHCPTKAVFTNPYGSNLRLPEVNAELCIGCGACEHACPVKPDKAIRVHGLYRHAVARKAVEAKAVAPKSTKDFPF